MINVSQQQGSSVGADVLSLRGSAAQSGELRIYEDTDNGTNFSSFKVGVQAADLAYILPTAFGSAGYVLTDAAGDGILSWAAAGAGSGATVALDNLSGVAINAALVLATSDAFALGSTTKQWSDLFLAEGGVINWDAGDATLTQVGNVVTLAGADLAISNLTASEIVITDGSKNLVSAAIATYPSLTELTYVKGVTSAIQTQLGTKAPTTSPTFATSITGSYLTASEILITDGSKNIVSAAVATYPSLTELTYVKGVTSAIQTQLTARLPLAGGTMSGNITLGENTSIALDPAGSADGKYTGITIAGTAGAALAFGDLVYLAAADSRWELVDADSVTTSDRMMGMVVLAAAADGDPTVLLLVGQIRADAKFPALTIGSAVYAGEAVGEIQVAIPTGADAVIRRVGYALTADEIYFNPSMDSQTVVA